MITTLGRWSRQPMEGKLASADGRSTHVARMSRYCISFNSLCDWYLSLSRSLPLPGTWECTSIPSVHIAFLSTRSAPPPPSYNCTRVTRSLSISRSPDSFPSPRSALPIRREFFHFLPVLPSRLHLLPHPLSCVHFLPASHLPAFSRTLLAFCPSSGCPAHCRC